MRMALGAQREQVLWLTLDDGLRRAALGLVLGLAGGVAAPQNPVFVQGTRVYFVSVVGFPEDLSSICRNQLYRTRG
jgi:hypothetical protein